MSIAKLKPETIRLVRQLVRTGTGQFEQGTAVLSSPGLLVHMVRYDGNNLGTVINYDADLDTWTDFAEVNLYEVNGGILLENTIYKALAYGENSSGVLQYFTQCCDGSPCAKGVTDCDQCGCASTVFSFDINNAEVSSFNGHYEVSYLSSCLWSGSNGNVEATLKYGDTPGSNGTCWHVVLDDGTDQMVFAIDCVCSPISGYSQVCCGFDENSTFVVSFNDCDCLDGITYNMVYSHTSGGILYYTSGTNELCEGETWQFYIYCINNTWKLLPSYSCDLTAQTPVTATSASCDPFELQFDLVFPDLCECDGVTVVVNQPPTCPTTICITPSGIDDGGCNCAVSMNVDTELDGVCVNGVGTYTASVTLCDVTAYRWYCEIDWNDDYTDGEISLKLQEPLYEDGNQIGWQSFGEWYSASGSFPRSVGLDLCSSSACNTCPASAVSLALGSCSGGGEADCSCTPPSTLYATIIDWTTGNCSNCIDDPITLHYDSVSQKWMGGDPMFGCCAISGTPPCPMGFFLRCNNDTWQLNCPLIGSTWYDADYAICSPFNAQFLIPLYSCPAYIQITE